MDYENLVDKFKKYHYIIVVGKKAALLGSSNSSKEAVKLAEDFILKKKNIKPTISLKHTNNQK